MQTTFPQVAASRPVPNTAAHPSTTPADPRIARPIGPRPRPGTRRRPADRRPPSPRVPGRAAAGVRCDGHTSVVDTRRHPAVAILTGAALAVLVWLIGMAGAGYQEAVTPQPVVTQVTHVRAGESLAAIAARVAPGEPAEAVIAVIVDLNDLPGSRLRVGQPLLTPTYR
ncbi:MAG: LysM peptidoglycan-binding domain-containing protein [Gordonia sp. (in: high G+C Gram-positive bacteria)]